MRLGAAMRPLVSRGVVVLTVSEFGPLTDLADQSGWRAFPQTV